MHLLKTCLPVRLTATHTLQSGEYLVEDISGAQLLIAADGDSMTPLTERRPFDENKDWSGKRILVVRTGGLGDLVLLTPILREINLRWPTAKIDVCAITEFGQALHHLPYVRDVVSYPMTKDAADEYDCWIFLENAIERNEDAKELHSVDVVAKMIGLTGEFNKRQEYRVTMRETIWAEEAYPRVPGVRRLCVQPTASARCRNYPEGKLHEVCDVLLKDGWEIFLLAKPGEMQIGKDIPNLRLLADGLTFRQRCAVLATADCVLAPDSSMTHVAGALEVPCVALYGPFPWQVRTKYSPTTVAISGVGKCAPCFPHNRAGQAFPEKCPSKARGVCEVLEGIEPKRVLTKIRLIARGFTVAEPPDKKVIETRESAKGDNVVEFKS